MTALRHGTQRSIAKQRTYKALSSKETVNAAKIEQLVAIAKG